MHKIRVLRRSRDEPSPANECDVQQRRGLGIDRYSYSAGTCRGYS